MVCVAISCKNFLYVKSFPELMPPITYLVGYSGDRPDFPQSSLEAAAAGTCHPGVSVTATGITIKAAHEYGLPVSLAQDELYPTYTRLDYVNPGESAPGVRVYASMGDLSSKLSVQGISHEIRQSDGKVVASWHPGPVSAVPVEEDYAVPSPS